MAKPRSRSSGFAEVKDRIRPFIGKRLATWDRDDLLDINDLADDLTHTMWDVLRPHGPTPPLFKDTVAYRDLLTMLHAVLNREIVARETKARQVSVVDLADMCMHVARENGLVYKDEALCACNERLLPVVHGRPLDCDGHVFDGCCK